MPVFGDRKGSPTYIVVLVVVALCNNNNNNGVEQTGRGGGA